MKLEIPYFCTNHASLCVFRNILYRYNCSLIARSSAEGTSTSFYVSDILMDTVLAEIEEKRTEGRLEDFILLPHPVHKQLYK